MTKHLDEFWPWIEGDSNVAILENLFYIFCEYGTRPENPAGNYSLEDAEFVAKNMECVPYSTKPEDLGVEYVILSGRQYADRLYELQPEDRSMFGRWSKLK